MKNFVTALLVLLAVTLVGCVPKAARMVNLATPFDADKARELSQGKGNNTIKGSALMRQAGGGVVTCAGQTVSLLPATAYADERIQTIYGNTQRGVLSLASQRVEFSPDFPEYRTLQQSSMCDAQGYFKFEEVPDGEYFLTAPVTWSVGYNPQGGFLMLRVEVKGGKTAEVVLAP